MQEGKALTLLVDKEEYATYLTACLLSLAIVFPFRHLRQLQKTIARESKQAVR